MDRGRAFSLVLLALGAPLAGCAGDGQPEAASRLSSLDEAPPAPEAPAGADAPEWSRGDAWAIVPTGGGATAATLVVTAANADHYVVSTTDQDAAAYDALHDVSYLGRIRRADLAGAQQDQPVQFFSFPLSDGKTWQATWDGRAVSLRAAWVPAMETSAGVHPGFAIEGRVGDEVYVKYDYVPALKWWSHLSFATGYGFKVQRAFENWTGGYVAAEARTLLEHEGGLPYLLTFTVDEEQTFAAVSLRAPEAPRARAFALVDPSGQYYPAPGAGVVEASAGGPLDVEVRIPPSPGEWRIASPVAQAEGSVHLLVRQVRVSLVPFP